MKAAQPKTALQLAQEGRLKRGAQGWGTLTDAQRAAWAQATVTFGLKAKGTRRQKPKLLSGSQYYTSLTAKFLACTPGGTVPVNPPATKFTGDTVSFTLTATTGNLTVAANQANKAGVKVEILTQRLAAGYRKPAAGGYRVKGYVQFAAGSLSVNLAVAPGAYSVAVQFVNAATGETSGYQVLGTGVVTLALEDGGLADGDETLAQAA